MSKTEKTDTGLPVEVVPGGLKIRWKFIMSCLGLLLGGGTIAGLVTTVGVGSSVADEFITFKTKQTYEHARIDSTLEDQNGHAKKQDTKIEEVVEALTSVQTIQRRDVARNEARRLTEKISSRDVREREYDRMYELNLKRLNKGVDPCGTLECD